MRDPEEFDAFYKDARDRLLVQTFALTGDVRASRSAVRDTFVVAWHHWRKVSRDGDPESWARPHAWQHAHRRHTARRWHRERGLEPEVAATLEALGKLTYNQRRVLLLTHLATVSLDQMAREVSQTVETTTRELQTATSQFAVHRDVPTTVVPTVLRSLFETTLDARWPRASIIRRAGATRRRTHTAVGAVVAVAAGAGMVKPVPLRAVVGVCLALLCWSLGAVAGLDGDPVRAGVVGLVLVVLVPVGWERVRPVGPRRATGASAEPARAGRTAARRAAEKRSAEKRPGSHAR